MNIPGIVVGPKASQLLDTLVQAPAHAVLLAGPQGTGKSHVATTLAATILGAEESALENHVYYQVVQPQKGSISIEQIRGLIGFFRLKVPGTAAVKRVAVVADADTMGHEAQNALLKLLEEPPEDSVLLLTSSQPDHLLPTIRSRTQILQLGNPEPDAVVAHLVSLGYDKQQVTAALLRSGANISAAVTALEGGDASADVLGQVKQALGGTSYERLLLVDGLAKQKDAAIRFADTLATVAIASLQAAASKGSSSLDKWKQVLEAANTAQEALERNGNAKLVLTELMLGL